MEEENKSKNTQETLECVKEETEKEFEEFKKYVEKLGYIRDYAVNIEGE